MTISLPPTLTYTTSVTEEATSASIDLSHGKILWDDNSVILWDDNSAILWSSLTNISAEKSYSFSPPRISYSGEFE